MINANFDLRAQLYQISEGNLEMIRVAREAGATADFAGSGRAIAGTYSDEDLFRRLKASLVEVGVGVIKPLLSPPANSGKTN